MTPLPTRVSRRRPWARLVLLACALLAACAHRPPPSTPMSLLHDELFADAQPPADRDQVFVLSEAMRRYADAELGHVSGLRDARLVLLDALYRQGGLRLSYDAAGTRNAAQAFEARAGNCLSLVIMTAAFARYMGMPVTFQSVLVDESYARNGDLLLVSGHVNLVLGQVRRRSTFSSGSDELTVDFLPAEEIRGQRSQPIPESTVLAMYFNNRAGESLVEGRLSESYAWAREAIRREPGFRPAINTLGVVYMRSSHLAEAEAALRHVLAQEPDNSGTLSNLLLVLQRSGRTAEAQAVARQLAQVQPEAPFQLFDQGRRAMAQGEYAKARELFARELRLQPYQSEVHFWAALADWHLGDSKLAARHLQSAVENSGTRQAQEIYAGKLARLRELQRQ